MATNLTISGASVEESILDALDKASLLTLAGAHHALELEQDKGFPTDPDEYTLFFKAKGQGEKRRNINGIPYTIAVPPARFRFVERGGTGRMLEAVREAIRLMTMNSPVGTRPGRGRLRQSIVLLHSQAGTGFHASSGMRVHVTAAFLNAHVFAPTDRFMVLPITPYSRRLETGEKHKQWIFKTARKLGAKFGSDLSIRRWMVDSAAIGASFYDYAKPVALPAIEIAASGIFTARSGRVSYRNRR